ncbi:hypothetical protein CEE45_17260 [Candidatus Heimdallarchaeota archaeon B3_Heim]|nr:MAG: hypothetical protein CEE45_17260 [Candidatus Heimdallarchaeota archaeon B3_Heim]
MTSKSTRLRGKHTILSPPVSILGGTLASTEPPEEDYSRTPYVDFLECYISDVELDYFKKRRPLIEHEMLSKTGHQFYILRGKTARGKSEAMCVYTLHETLKEDSYAFVLAHNRGLAEELKDKFATFMRRLSDTRQIVAYYKDTEEENALIRDQVREGQDRAAVFIMTPFMLLGSFTSFSLMGQLEYQEVLDQLGDRDMWGKVFSSFNYRWAEKLSSPSIILIDEVDSYPLSVLLCLSIFVRFLIRKNPGIKVILSSATVSNPDLFATLFFGPESDYLDQTGLGRRGTTNINVYCEDEPQELLEYFVQEVKTYIQAERAKVKPGNKYVPRKIILFLNNKRDIDIKKLIGTFSAYFTTVHGDMLSKTVAKRIRNFRHNRLQICLVATSIIQTGLDIPDAFWVIFYGIPHCDREYLQQRGRSNRDPSQEGKIDIILRASNTFENNKAANVDALAHFIFQEEPPPFQTPLFTPLTLQYAIVMGVVFGFWNIVDQLKKGFYGRDDSSYLQEVEQAYIKLLDEHVVTVGSDEQICPTATTKRWIHAFPRRFGTEIYTVILRTKTSKERKLGTIRLLELFRRGLPSQTLTYIDDTYQVVEINPTAKTVYVTKGFLELYTMKNKVKKTITATEILAHDLKINAALVEVIETERVVKKDIRTGSFDLNNVPLAQNTDYTGIFIKKKKITIPVERKIRKYCDILNIDRSVFRSTTCYHEELGLGSLLIDTSNLGLASMFYQQWILLKKTRNKIKNKKEQKNVQTQTLYQEKKNRFHRYLDDYHFTVGCIADLHFNGQLITINGQEVNFRQFCYTLVKPLKNASVIIFLGDTIDRLAAHDFTIARAQLSILYETLDQLNLLHKTIFILGNHDYDMRYFRWRKPINTMTEIRWSLKPYQDLIFIHGHNSKMEQYLGKQEITAKKVYNWRTNFSKPVNGKKVRISDIVVSGHLHKGFCNREQYSLGVPSARNYWLFPQNEGWIGLFGFSTFDDPWEPLIAIEDPYKCET